MKKLTEHYKETLLDQAIDFYYRSCDKAEISPILVGRKMSKVGSKFVILRNAKGAEIKVRHTSTYLFCQASGAEFSEKIKLSSIISPGGSRNNVRMLSIDQR